MTLYLKRLIVEHQKLFKSFYRDRDVTAKHHYPSSIREAEPLLRMCLRGAKGKHDMFKTLFKPLKQIWSKARKHQFAVACHCEPLTSNKMSLTKSFSVKDQNEVRMK